MRREKTYSATAAYGEPTIEFKSRGDKGEFEAVVSVFGNTDYQGDRVVRGAFAHSLAKWHQSGDPIPIIWSHDWGNPHAHVGSADPRLAVETDRGLKLIGKFDLDKPFARQVYDLVKSRRVREWSFAYDIEDERIADDGANELLTLDIIEAGPTLKGANSATETLGVKSFVRHADGVVTGTTDEERWILDFADFVAGGFPGKTDAEIATLVRDYISNTSPRRPTTEAAKLRDAIHALVASKATPHRADVVAELDAHEQRVVADRADRARQAAATQALAQYQVAHPSTAPGTVLLLDEKMRPIRDDARDDRDADEKRRALAAVDTAIGEVVQGGVRVERTKRTPPKNRETVTLPSYVNRSDG